MENTQNEQFEAETHWFHVFKSMVESGDLAKMSGSSIKIYLVIKAHTNFSTGISFPAVETISQKSGLSVAQVKRELKFLEEKGYISKKKSGRNNTYTLREKVEIQDEYGRPTAVASWDYVPSSVKSAVADLKNVLITGDFAGAKVVNIERLYINFINVNDHGTLVNVQDSKNFPKDMQENLESCKK